MWCYEGRGGRGGSQLGRDGAIKKHRSSLTTKGKGGEGGQPLSFDHFSDYKKKEKEKLPKKVGKGLKTTTRRK